MANTLGWIFKTDGNEGIPYIQCPYCSRRIGGETILFGTVDLSVCPDCGKAAHLDNLTEENYLQIRMFYWGE